MKPAHHLAVRDAADAELRGDAATALERHRSVPMFATSNHGDRLAVLAALGDHAPPWLISRWLTVQSRRRMWTGSDPDRVSRVLPRVIPRVYPHGVQFEPIGCEHPEQVIPYINERDWVVRQYDVYELGSLRDLLHRAGPELVSRADHIEEWCRVPMGGYRLEPDDRGPDAVRLIDLASGHPVDVLDLGILEELEPGQHLLGRVVPTRSGPGRMLDWRPLPVDRWTATAVSRNPRLWLAVLANRVAEGRLPTGFSYALEASITADLPTHSWIRLLGRDHEPWLHYDELAEPALAEALRLAESDPTAAAARRHTIGELVMDPVLGDRTRSRFAAPDFLAGWRALAEVVPGPARGRCHEMAMWCDAASGPDLRAG